MEHFAFANTLKFIFLFYISLFIYMRIIIYLYSHPSGPAGDNQTCIGDEVMADCYQSCWEQNQCGRCNWSGCYDERLFIFSIIEARYFLWLVACRIGHGNDLGVCWAVLEETYFWVTVHGAACNNSWIEIYENHWFVKQQLMLPEAIAAIITSFSHAFV